MCHISSHTYIHACMHAYLPTYLHTYMHACMHTYIHTVVHTYLSTYLPTYLHTYLPTYTRTYLPKYIHTYLPSYLHTYIHTWVWIWILSTYQIISKLIPVCVCRTYLGALQVPVRVPKARGPQLTLETIGIQPPNNTAVFFLQNMGIMNGNVGKPMP